MFLLWGVQLYQTPPGSRVQEYLSLKKFIGSEKLNYRSLILSLTEYKYTTVFATLLSNTFTNRECNLHIYSGKI